MSKTLKNAYIDAVAQFITHQTRCVQAQNTRTCWDCIQLPYAASRILETKEAWEKSVDIQTAVEGHCVAYETIIRHAAKPI